MGRQAPTATLIEVIGILVQVFVVSCLFAGICYLFITGVDRFIPYSYRLPLLLLMIIIWQYSLLNKEGQKTRNLEKRVIELSKESDHIKRENFRLRRGYTQEEVSAYFSRFYAAKYSDGIDDEKELDRLGRIQVISMRTTAQISDDEAEQKAYADSHREWCENNVSINET